MVMSLIGNVMKIFLLFSIIMLSVSSCGGRIQSYGKGERSDSNNSIAFLPFQGWKHVKALGARVDFSGITDLNAFTVSETATVLIEWNDTGADSYKIFRSTISEERGTEITPHVTRSGTSALDSYNIVSSPTYNEAGETYYYTVVPVYAGIEVFENTETDTQIMVMIPPANMVLIHRWIGNKVICDEMGREIDRSSNYTCLYDGPGNVNGRYDIEEHFFLDRFEASKSYGADEDPGTADDVEITDFMNAPGLAPWVYITQTASAAKCSLAKVRYNDADHDKILMSRKLQIVVSAWASSLSNVAEVESAYENGISPGITLGWSNN